MSDTSSDHSVETKGDSVLANVGHKVKDWTGFAKSAWKLISPYWKSEHKGKAVALLGVIVALNMTEIGLAAGIAFCSKYMIDALIAKSAMGLAGYGAATLGMMASTSVADKVKNNLIQRLRLNWRGYLTDQFRNAWLSDNSHYKLATNRKVQHSPDQRIAVDTALLTDKVLGLGLGFVSSVMSVVTFAGMLLQYSSMMVAAAAFISIGGAFVTHRIGKPLQKASNDFQNAEAEHRQALVRVMNHAEDIAARGLEQIEEEGLSSKFKKVYDSDVEVLRLQRNLGFFQAFNAHSSTVVPVFLAAPQVISGAMSVGGIELVRQSYSQLYNALSWFTYAYPVLAECSSAVERLSTFSDALEQSKRKPEGNEGEINRAVAAPQSPTTPKQTEYMKKQP